MPGVPTFGKHNPELEGVAVYQLATCSVNEITVFITRDGHGAFGENSVIVIGLSNMTIPPFCVDTETKIDDLATDKQLQLFIVTAGVILCEIKGFVLSVDEVFFRNVEINGEGVVILQDAVK